MLSETKLICSGFGLSKHGRLGHTSSNQITIPTIISFSQTVFMIAAGQAHTVFLTQNYQVFSFGRNTFGQLGLGHTQSISQPQLAISLQHTRIEDIHCGFQHTLAISWKGQLFVWGLNIKGQLGLGDRINRLQPTLVQISSRKKSSSLQSSQKILSAAGGGLHSLILTDKNRVFSAGQAKFGALGLNYQEDQWRFRQVKHLEGNGKIQKIAAGLNHSSAIVQGNVYLWGTTSIFMPLPTAVSLQTKIQSPNRMRSNSPRSGNVQEVTCGKQFTACLSKGKVYTWGKQISLSPQEIPTQAAVRHISAGFLHLICITVDYQVLMWDLKTGNLQNLPWYQNTQPSRVACGPHHTLVLSHSPPLQVHKELSQVEISRLLKQNQELKGSPQRLKISRKGYIHNDPVKTAIGNNRNMTPLFQINFSELELQDEPIGRGGYGTVYRARWRGSVVAVKKMKIDPSQDRFNEFVRECQTMISIRHPNITLFLGACTQNPNLCLVMEYCGHGSLWEVLRDHNKPLPWYLRCKIALDTARGVNYLHKFPRPVLHRDLKSLNILLDDAMNAKIADFGWTRIKADAMTCKIGTYQWMAPQVICSHEYTEKADIYSFGIIMWELASRKPPYRDKTGFQVSKEVVNNDLRPPLPSRCPQQFLNLMTRCWQKNPEDRPSFELIIIELEAFLKFLERSSI